MSEFIYYEIDDDAMTARLRAQLGRTKGVRMRRPEAGRWLVRTTRKLTPAAGRRRVEMKRWRESAVDRAPIGVSPSGDLLRRRWTLAADGERRGALERRRGALRLRFGEGRGDAVTLTCEAQLTDKARQLRALIRSPDAHPVTVSVELRSARGRVVKRLPEVTLAPGDSHLIAWPLRGVSASLRGQVALTSLVLSTEADDTSALVEALRLV